MRNQTTDEWYNNNTMRTVITVVIAVEIKIQKTDRELRFESIIDSAVCNTYLK